MAAHAALDADQPAREVHVVPEQSPELAAPQARVERAAPEGAVLRAKGADKRSSLGRRGDALAPAARRRESQAIAWIERQVVILDRAPVDTDAGEMKVVPEPAGTRGYDDLRRAASREPLGSGLRPSVASLGDAARMLAALGREQDFAPLRTVRRLIELERELGLGLER